MASASSHKTYTPREDLPAFSVPRQNLLRMELSFKGLGVFQWVGVIFCVLVAVLIMFFLPLNFLDFTTRSVMGVLFAFAFGVGVLYPFNDLTAVQWLFQIQKFRKSRIGRRTRSRLEISEPVVYDEETDED